MGISQIHHPNLHNFLENRQKEILAIAQKNTEEIVKKETALMDFELLLSVNTSEKEQINLTNKSRKLREECWNELSQKSNGNFKKMNELLNNI